MVLCVSEDWLDCSFSVDWEVWGMPEDLIILGV